MEQDLETIFSDREEIMKDKWIENRPSKLVHLCFSPKKPRESWPSTAVNGATKLGKSLQICSMPQQRYSNGETIFHLLARDNHADAITDLLQKGYKIDKDDHGLYPWQTAAAYGNIEAIRSFYDHNDLKIYEPCEHFQFTILHIAVLGTGKIDKLAKMIEYIVKNICEIDINVTDMYGRTPLFCAGQYQKPKLGEVLLALGADPVVITSFRYSVLGMAIGGCPDLTISLMDWAIAKEKEDPSQSIMTKQEVKILYYTKVEDRIMLHPYIKHIIGDINKGKSFDLQLIALLCYIMNAAFVNWLCLTNVHEAHGFFNFFGDSVTVEYIFYRIAIICTIALIIFDLVQAKGIVKSLKNMKKRRDDLQGLAGYKLTAYHPDISADKMITIKRARNIHWIMVKNTILETIELIICLLGKVTVLTCQFMPHQVESGGCYTRDYLLSIALVVIWWEMYRKLLWLTIIPEDVVISGLVIQRCMFAILEIISVVSLIFIPFILILVKISLNGNVTIYKGKNDGTNSNLGQMLLFAVGHMFRLLTLDSYHDYEFESGHPIFLSFLYPVAMSIFSLVVLNMCIAKLSIEYKDITDNAQYEINRQRLYIKAEWAAETIKAERAVIITWEKVRTWFRCHQQSLDI